MAEDEEADEFFLGYQGVENGDVTVAEEVFGVAFGVLFVDDGLGVFF